MKVLVCAKRVVDSNVKVQIKDDYSDVDIKHSKMSLNPFDENAIEEAVKLKEQGIVAEIIVVSIGSEKCAETLKIALARGCDRAILVNAPDGLEPIMIAQVLKPIIIKEQPHLILMGKQAIDDDANQVGQMLAGMLDYPQGTFISKLEIANNKAKIWREIDNGTEILELELPAVLTADLHLNQPRFIKLPQLMLAKKKPIEQIDLANLGIEIKKTSKILKVNDGEIKKHCKILNNIDEVVSIIQVAQENPAEILANNSIVSELFNHTHNISTPSLTDNVVKILVITNSPDKKLNSSLPQLLSAAKDISSMSSTALCDVLIVGHLLNDVAHQISKFNIVNTVLQLDDINLENILAENIALQLSEIIKNYTHVIVNADSFGKNLLPRIAGIMGLGQISEVTEILDANIFKKFMYAGNVLVNIEILQDIKLLSIRANNFAAYSGLYAPGTLAYIQKLNYTNKFCDKIKFIDHHMADKSVDLSSAQIVVSGGVSLSSAENFNTYIRQLAAQLNAAVGATRAAVEAGFAPNDCQVGQTGTIVAPTLYVAIGISGAVQHITGMKDSKIVIALNSDRNAPIFEYADYGIVGDLFELVPQLMSKLC
ncbi:MAG: FAD-binding protein [Burkholderiales bacterium]|nr:FAD-binding protein [Burkholderiales bacterium]